MDRIGDPVLNTLGESIAAFNITALQNSYDYGPYTLRNPLEIIEENGLATGIRLSTEYDRDSLENYTRLMTKMGLDRIYLVDKERNPVAFTLITEPIMDGILEFRDFCLNNLSIIESDDYWFLEYYEALFNQTELPIRCNLKGCQYVDADGNVSLQDSGWNYSISYKPQDISQALREKLQSMKKKHNFELKENSTSFGLLLDLPLDDNLSGAIAEKLPPLIEDIMAEQPILPKGIIIFITDELDNEGNWNYRCRLSIDSAYDALEQCFTNDCTKTVWGDGIEPWEDAINQWWSELDLSAYNLEKHDSLLPFG